MMTITLKTKILTNRIAMRAMKITAIETLKTVIKTMRNTTIPNKSLQTTTHHTIQMVRVVMKTIELGNGKENNRTLDTTVSLSTV
jgi:hypothetical protein